MKISEILDDISSQNLVLPEFQREYVWEKEQAKQLMVSFYRNYPTGSLLFWKTDDPPDLKNLKIPKDKIGTTTVILDGQQRLTTLYLFIKNEIPPYYRKEDIKNDPRNLYFNLEDGNFQYYLQNIMNNNARWVAVTDCFSSNSIDVFKISSTLEEDADARFKLANLLNENLNRLKNVLDKEYPIQYVPMTENVDVAIDVFDRVNSLGTKLTDADLALAHICGKWPQARRVMKEKIAELSKNYFYFELSFMVRCLTGIVRGRALFETIHDAKEKELKDGWNKVSKALDYILNILPTHANINSTEDLNSTNVLVPLVVYLGRNVKFKKLQNLKTFVHWIYAAHTWARYTGQTDQRLDHDISILLNSKNPTKNLIDAIIEQRGRIEVKANDLQGKWIQDPLYKMNFIICKANDAIDWFNGVPLVKNVGKYYQIHSHHIFPQSLLYEKGGYSPENHIHKKIVNEIANRAFITSETNLELTNRPPKEYLKEIQEEYPGALEKQLIPTDPELWELNRFEDFLAKRRDLIADSINKYMDTLLREVPPEKLETLDDYLNGESAYIEYKLTARYDVRQKSVSEVLQKAILKTFTGFMNSQGGVLLIGVADDCTIFGIDKDIETLKSHSIDEYQRFLYELISSHIGIEFCKYVHFTFEEKNSKTVAIIKVEQAPKPVFIEEKDEKEFYVRIGNSTKPLDIEAAHNYIGMHW